MASAGINIGDAVLTVLVDLTQLDQLEARLASELPGALKPGQDAVAKVSTGFNQMETSANQAAAGATKAAAEITAAGKAGATAGQNIAEGGKKAAAGLQPVSAEVSTIRTQIQYLQAQNEELKLQLQQLGEKFEEIGPHAAHGLGEARGELALLGEATGVTLPRHVRSFVAELPGVGEALNAAFEATAIFFVITAVVELTNKVTEFVSETFIFTEAMKKSNEIISQMNPQLLTVAANVKKLKDEYALLGLTGVAKTNEEIKQLQVSITQNNSALGEAKTKLDSLTNSTAAFQEQHATEIAETQAQFILLSKQAQDFEQQKTNLEKQGSIERRAARLVAANLQLEDEKAFQKVFIDYDTQAQRLLLANRGLLAQQGSALEAIAQERIYQVELSYLQKKRKLLDDDTNATIAQKNDLDSKILDLQTAHGAALIKSQAEITQGIRDLTLQNVAQPWEFTADDISSATLKIAHSLEDMDAKATRSLSHQGDLLKVYAQGLAQTGSKAKAMGLTIEGVYNDVLLAQGGAIQQAILGQKSWGAALAEATKEELAAVAARSAVWALYWLGRAIADSFWNPPAAAAEFTAAEILGSIAVVAAGLSYAIPGGKDSSGSGQSGPGQGVGAISTSPVGTTDATPVQTTNTQRFGSGAVVKGPGLATIGDDKHGNGAFEAVLPLDNQEAMGRIVGALLGAFNPRAFGNAQSFDGAVRRSGILSGQPQPLLSADTLALGARSIQAALSSRSASSAGQEVDFDGIADRLTERIADRLQVNVKGGGDIHVHAKGDLVDLHQVATKITRNVVKGKSRLKSSDSFRVTKRS